MNARWLNFMALDVETAVALRYVRSVESVGDCLTVTYADGEAVRHEHVTLLEMGDKPWIEVVECGS